MTRNKRAYIPMLLLIGSDHAMSRDFDKKPNGPCETPDLEHLILINISSYSMYMYR